MRSTCSLTSGFLLLVAAGLLLVSRAQAGIVTYTDRASFEAALAPAPFRTNVTFSGLAPAGGYAVYPTDSTFGNVAFTRNAAAQESMYALNGASWGQGFATGVENMALNSVSQTATPPSGQTAVGVDVYRLVEGIPDNWQYGESQYATVTVTYSDLSTTTFTLDWGLTEPGALQDTGKFVGVSSSAPGLTITSVTFSGNEGPNGSLVIDNFTYGLFIARGVKIYTDRSSFLAALASSETVTFSGLAPAGVYQLYPVSSTFGNVAFSGSGDSMFALNGASWGQGFTAGMENMALNGLGQTATPPSGKNAVGVDVYRLFNQSYAASRYVILTVTYSDNRTDDIWLDWGLTEPGALQTTGKFVGVTSSDPNLTIKSFSFTGSAPPYGSPVLDNFTYGRLIDRRGTLISVF